MFGAIRDDFDPTYWTRASVAITCASATAAVLGTSWLVFEVVTRLMWFLIAFLVQLLAPPQLALLVLPPPPVQITLTEQIVERDLHRSVAVTELDLADMGDFDPLSEPDPDWSAEPPPLHDEREELDRMLVKNMGLLSILGSSSSGEGAIADIFGSGDGFGNLDSALGGLLGTTIGDDGFGAGGLGASGIGMRGGGGTGEGIGLGTIGTIGRGGGELSAGGGGQGYGRIGGLGNGTAARVGTSAKPRMTKPVVAWLEANGDTTCRVTVTVGADGEPSNLQAACPEPIREAALDAARRTTFVPSSGGGRNTVAVSYRFVLR